MEACPGEAQALGTIIKLGNKAALYPGNWPWVQRLFLRPSYAGLCGKSRDREQSFARRPEPPKVRLVRPSEQAPCDSPLGLRHRSCLRGEGGRIIRPKRGRASVPAFKTQTCHLRMPFVPEHALTLTGGRAQAGRGWSGGASRHEGRQKSFPTWERTESMRSGEKMFPHHAVGQVSRWSQVTRENKMGFLS